MTTRYRIVGPSPASIVAGCHQDGETVTVTGIANGLNEQTASDDTRTGATFALSGDRTRVQVELRGKTHREAWDLIGTDRDMRPIVVTVTGEVSRFAFGSPYLVATDVNRHGAPLAPYGAPLHLDRRGVMSTAAEWLALRQAVYEAIRANGEPMTREDIIRAVALRTPGSPEQVSKALAWWIRHGHITGLSDGNHQLTQRSEGHGS